MKIVMDIKFEVEVEDFDTLELNDDNDFGRALVDGKLSMRCSSGGVIVVDDDGEVCDDFCDPDEVPMVINEIIDKFINDGVLTIGEKA